MVHRTGKYKLLNLVFGAFPFMAACFITQIKEDSGPAQLWFSIVRLRCVARSRFDECRNEWLLTDTARVRKCCGSANDVGCVSESSQLYDVSLTLTSVALLAHLPRTSEIRAERRRAVLMMGSLTHRISDGRGHWIRPIVPWIGCIPTCPSFPLIR